MRTYEGRPGDGDVALLAEEMGPFVAYVRERVLYRDDEAQDALPRWSGY